MKYLRHVNKMAGTGEKVRGTLSLRRYLDRRGLWGDRILDGETSWWVGGSIFVVLWLEWGWGEVEVRLYEVAQSCRLQDRGARLKWKSRRGCIRFFWKRNEWWIFLPFIWESRDEKWGGTDYMFVDSAGHHGRKPRSKRILLTPHHTTAKSHLIYYL